MRSRKTMIRHGARGGALVALALLAGCGYAKRKDVDAQMTQLRQDMQAGDQQLDSRVSELSTKVDGIDSRTAQLERDLQSLRSDFNTTVERMEGMLSFNVPVHFDFDRAELRPEDTAVLDKFAAVVKGYYPGATVTVEGFTDPAGSRAYNEKLGERRAEAVKQYLISTGGLDGATVRVVSYGEAPDRLMNEEAGEDQGALLNRRVSLVIDFGGTQAGAVSDVTALN